MIGRFDHDVDATLDRAPEAVNGTRWWYLACECAELVRDHAHLPRAIAIRQPQHLGRRLVLIARAKWTVRGIRACGRGSRCTINCSGRLARSVAITTHALVKQFWRSSGMVESRYFLLPKHRSMST